MKCMGYVDGMLGLHRRYPLNCIRKNFTGYTVNLRNDSFNIGKWLSIVAIFNLARGVTVVNLYLCRIKTCSNSFI
jgi:hypothetical protein